MKRFTYFGLFACIPLALFFLVLGPRTFAQGGESPQAMQRASALVSERTRGSKLATIDGAKHFMIATHASEVAGLIAQHVYQAEARQNVPV